MSQIKLTADSGGGTISLKAPSSTTSNADVVLKLPVADGSANQVLKTDGSGQLSFGSDISDLVNDSSPQLGGDLASNGHDIKIADASGYDGNNIYMGSDNDVRIIHDGNNFEVTNSTGDASIQSADDIFLKPQGGENGIKVIGDGAVELYHDNSKKFETTSSGVEIHNDLLLDGSANLGNYIRTNYDGGGHMYFRNNSGSSLNFSSHFQTYRDTDEAGTAQTHIHYYHGGYCELLHQGDSVIRTLANGVQFRDGGAVKGQFTDQGLCFGTDTAAANALDDYEEGTWTPVIMYYSSSWGNATLDAAGTISVPRYTKIGRWVTASFNWEGFQVNSGTTGYAQIGGLPFTATATGAGLVSLNNCFSSDQEQGAWVANGHTTAQFYRKNLNWNNWNSNSGVRLQLTCHYQAS